MYPMCATLVIQQDENQTEKEQKMAEQRFYPMSELVQAVKDHAIANYETGGWDVIVEAYDDDMIKDLLKGKDMYRKSRVRTPKAAIRRVKEAADLIGSVRGDIMETAF